jgi:endonuclease/exonuclease/phosphatase family metal-dependent hydrolase
VQALIRSWNLFNGNSVPPTRHGHLRAMVELATADRPAILCLQEVPVWALPQLAGWSGMQAYWLDARPPRRPTTLAAAITRLHTGFFRSRLAGQANAILTDRSLPTTPLSGVQISEEGRERRVVHAVRIDQVGVVANLHASNTGPEVVVRELVRARAFVDTRAAPDEARILAGDFNLAHPALAGYENGGPGLDHILVANAAATPLVTWPVERRVDDEHLLSDHAPVERLVGPARPSRGERMTPSG